MNRRTILARSLRNNPTMAEWRLWQVLRRRQLHGLKFTRQHPIGQYIVDFCCRERNLVIEVDGGGHDLNRHRDQIRTRYLQDCGYVVIRFWNSEVLKNLDGVTSAIEEAISVCAASSTGPTL